MLLDSSRGRERLDNFAVPSVAGAAGEVLFLTPVTDAGFQVVEMQEATLPEESLGRPDVLWYLCGTRAGCGSEPWHKGGCRGASCWVTKTAFLGRLAL